MGNADYIAQQLRARANERRAAAERQGPRHEEFRRHCEAEARFYDRAADCIERLMGEALAQALAANA